MGEASRESGLDWILSSKGKNDWRAIGRRHCCTRCECAHSYDHVDVLLGKHFGKLRQARWMSFGRRRQINKISPLAELGLRVLAGSFLEHFREYRARLLRA